MPVTFAFDDRTVVTAIDHKKKSTTELKRLENIKQFPEVTLLVDRYNDDDWKQLWWVRIRGRAKVHQSGREFDHAIDLLSDRYTQYAEKRPKGPAIVIERTELTGWKA